MGDLRPLVRRFRNMNVRRAAVSPAPKRKPFLQCRTTSVVVESADLVDTLDQEVLRTEGCFDLEQKRRHWQRRSFFAERTRPLLAGSAQRREDKQQQPKKADAAA